MVLTERMPSRPNCSECLQSGPYLESIRETSKCKSHAWLVCSSLLLLLCLLKQGYNYSQTTSNSPCSPGGPWTSIWPSCFDLPSAGVTACTFVYMFWKKHSANWAKFSLFTITATTCTHVCVHSSHVGGYWRAALSVILITLLPFLILCMVSKTPVIKLHPYSKTTMLLQNLPPKMTTISHTQFYAP